MTDGSATTSDTVEDRWRPLLDGARAKHARAIVEGIILALECQAPQVGPGFQGEASVALLLAYCGRPAATDRLEAALHATLAAPTTISLLAGASGIIWLMNQFTTGDEANSVIAHFETAVLSYLAVPRWKDHYDLIAGLAGVGVYAASRSGEHATMIADRVLFHLEATAITSDAGTTWRTAADLLGDARRAWFPTGMVDLGVAHGVPGVIGMLAQFVEADLQPERSRRLMQSSVTWLLSSIPGGQPRFGTNWPSDHAERKRIGWCYGDPGVAGVLLRASRALHSPDLEREALDLLSRAIPVLVERDIPDACFCHGLAGLAHIYNVAFQRTGNEQMRIEAERWLSEILQREKPGSGIAGYTFLKVDDRTTRWADDTTLVSGLTGIALVLLAAIEDRRPTWQSLFLL